MATWEVFQRSLDILAKREARKRRALYFLAGVALGLVMGWWAHA